MIQFNLYPGGARHKDALPITEKFMEELDSQWRRSLLYIRGHAHELRNEDD